MASHDARLDTTWVLLVIAAVCHLRGGDSAAQQVQWEYHAWYRDTGLKLVGLDYPRELPGAEYEAMTLICNELSRLPNGAELLAVTGSSFHPALNRLCQTARVACVYTDSHVGKSMPHEWQYNAVNFFPSSELRSQSILEFLKWNAWTEFAVLYMRFHDLERMQTLLPFPNGQVVFRTMNLENANVTFRLLTKLKLSTIHRYVLAVPQSLLPKFLNLASAANLTSMAYNFLLVGGLNRSFFNEHVASRLYSGMNFTSHQFDGVSLLGDGTAGTTIAELTRWEAVNQLLAETYAKWSTLYPERIKRMAFSNRKRGPNDLRLLDTCFVSPGDNATEFYSKLDATIQRRMGVVTVGGRRVYNFTFCVNHMYTETQPKI